MFKIHSQIIITHICYLMTHLHFKISARKFWESNVHFLRITIREWTCYWTPHFIRVQKCIFTRTKTKKKVDSLEFSILTLKGTVHKICMRTWVGGGSKILYARVRPGRGGDLSELVRTNFSGILDGRHVGIFAFLAKFVIFFFQWKRA